MGGKELMSEGRDQMSEVGTASSASQIHDANDACDAAGIDNQRVTRVNDAT